MFLSFFLIIETICPEIWAKIPLKNERSPFQVRRSKTPLLKSCILSYLRQVPVISSLYNYGLFGSALRVHPSEESS